jgi:hypothetical protein
MENLKHTEEYADKVCTESSKNEYIHSRGSFIKGYMKAIEETAAPDLLEALISLKETIEGIGWDGYYNSIVRDALNKTDNAINKATK